MRASPTGFLCLLLVLFSGLACMGLKKPWRNYAPIPFNSAEWLAGDAIERGRMTTSMFRNNDVHISTREDAIKTLGEPDIKKTIENREVWFYRVELGFGPEGMDLLPLSFDPKGRGSIGYAHGGTMSILTKESEL